ncbi:MAG: O-antigen ligase family protein [Solirubrobacteraceae bacterium]
MLIAIALLPLLLVVVARPERAVIAFAAVFYLNLPVLVAHHLHAPGALSSASALLLVAPLLAYLVVARLPLVVTPALPLMVGYLIVLVLSAIIPGGGGSGTVTPIVTFLTEGLLLYLLVTNVVRTPAMLRAVMWTVVVAGALMGLVSLWQEATHSYHTTLGGFAQVDATGFDVGTQLTGKALRPRLAGPIGEKNRYAQVLLVLLPLAVALARIERRRALRLLGAACAALILCGAMLTFSRGAAVALGILVLAMAAVKMITLRQLLVGVLAAVALVVVVAPDYVTRVQTLGSADAAFSQSPGTDAAIQGRATENLAAFYVFRDHPLLGVGPGQFFARYSSQYGNALDLRFLANNRRAHSLYLEIAADTGLLGLAAFLAIVGVTMVQLWKLTVFWRARSPELAMLARALLLALVAYLATGVFLQLAYQRYFWFLLALANAAVWMLRRQRRAAL